MIKFIGNVFEFFFYTSGENFRILLFTLRETKILYDFLSVSSPVLHVFLEITALITPVFLTFFLRSKFLRFFLGITIFISAIHIKTVLTCLLSPGPPYCSSEDFEGTADLAVQIVSIFYVAAILICTSIAKAVLQNKILLIKAYLRGRK
jgi:hypothetical protein